MGGKGRMLRRSGLLGRERFEGRRGEGVSGGGRVA